MLKAKKDLEPYAFFSWIEPYLKSRATKSNVSLACGDVESVASQLSSSSDQSDLEADIEEENESLSAQTSTSENNPVLVPDESSEPAIDAPQTKKRKAERKFKSNKPPKMSILDKKQMHIMEQMEKDLIRDRELSAPTKFKDSVDAFCESLALEMQKFDEQEICIIKHKINNITIFKHQMNKFSMRASFSNHGPFHASQEVHFISFISF